MGTLSSLAGTTPAAGHLTNALKVGRLPVVMVAQAQAQARDLIVTLKELIKDMPGGDPNIAAFNTLITNLS